MYSRSQQNLEFGHFTLLFCTGRQRNVPKCKTHVQSNCFSSFKPATHLAILCADRRDQRKSPGVPGAAIAIFADRSDRRIKSPISDMSAIKFAGIRQVCPSRDFLCSSLRIASKVNQSGWAIFSHDFSKRPSMEPGKKVEVPHRRDRRKKIARRVRINLDKSTSDFRWRLNSPRWAYKIARCVAGLNLLFYATLQLL